MKSDTLRIANLSSGYQFCQVFQIVQHRVTQLVPCELVDDTGEIFLVNVAILVFVEMAEGLSEAFSLKAFHELGELAIELSTSVNKTSSLERGHERLGGEGAGRT